MKTTNPLIGYIIILLIFFFLVGGATYTGLVFGSLDKPEKYQYGVTAAFFFGAAFLLGKTSLHHSAVEHHETIKNSIKNK